MNNDIDWKSAEEMLTTTENAYKELVGMPGVNPWFVLGALSSLRIRLEDGERTQSLYDAIVSQYDAM